MRKRIASESVTEGAPDALCDWIADGIVDELLRLDPSAQCACEVACGLGEVRLTGEAVTHAPVDYEGCVRKALHRIGTERSTHGLDDKSRIVCAIRNPYPDAARHGPGKALLIKGADQGTVFGYACNETPERMPLSAVLAHRLTRELDRLRKKNELPYLLPDGRAQVTLEYEGDRPLRAASVGILAQHQPEADLRRLRADLEERLVRRCIPAALLDARTEIRINPAGPVLLGGLWTQTGLSGRDALLHAYGGHARIGGGALPGRDPGRIERGGAYMARAVAKAVVAYGAASQCEVQAAYSEGREEPAFVWVDTRGTGRVPDAQLTDWVIQNYDFRRSAIIDCLQLRQPIYQNTARYGHFGHLEGEFPWEMMYNRPCGVITMRAIS